jgi:uncharacterized protein YeaO (DUF488 family)
MKREHEPKAVEKISNSCASTCAAPGSSIMIKTKRVYEPSAPSDGLRFLVERLWPRGVRKEELQFDAWLKDAAPSAELRKWFNHEPAKWKEFKRRYEAELKTRPEAWRPILEAGLQGQVTLLFSSHDAERNNVAALKDFLAKASRKATDAAK